MQEDVLYEVRDRIGLITLNRPDRLNAYTQPLGVALKRAMAEANGDRCRACRSSSPGQGAASVLAPIWRF